MAEKLPMPLSQAMHILCDVHTNDDPVAGFVIHVGADPYYRPSMHMRESGDYVEAWRTLRAAVGLPTKPEQYEDR